MNAPEDQRLGLIQEYEITGNKVLKSILELGIYLEGSYTKDELMQMPFRERQMLIEILKEKNNPNKVDSKMEEHFKKNPNTPYVVQDR